MEKYYKVVDKIRDMSAAQAENCTTLTRFKPHKDQSEMQGRPKNKAENKSAFIVMYGQLIEITSIYGVPTKKDSRRKWELYYVDLANMLNAVIPNNRLTAAQISLFLGDTPRARIPSDKVIQGFEVLLARLDEHIKKHSGLDMGSIAQQEQTLWEWTSFQF
jgi:hypothetical protein